MTLTPYWYQQEAIDKAIDYLCNSTGNGIIQVPTAGGKSLIQAEICKKVLEIAPHYKIICATHITKLLGQNRDEITTQCPEIKSGIYSAKYKSKNKNASVIFGGIQSIYKKAHVFGPVSLVLIDECQAVPISGNGMYIEFIDQLRKINPHLRVLALSASPWKINGPLVGEGIFDDIIYKIEMKTLLDEGFLTPLVTPKVKHHADTSKIKVSNTGEFNEKALQMVMDDYYLTSCAIDDALSHSSNRGSWLVFCSGVQHCINVCNALSDRGISAAYITGGTPQEEREEITRRFDSKQITSIVSCETITTGFNSKIADMILVLRATKSSGLWLQILGRGMRVHPDKKDCLVLDYGENIERFGPIDKIEAPDKKIKSKGKSDAPIKQCYNCEQPVPIVARSCPYCGVEFDVSSAPNHGTTASTAHILRQYKEPEWKKVDSITARKYVSRRSGKTTLRINYQCGIMTYSQWHGMENKWQADKFGQFWMKNSGGYIAPSEIDEAVKRISELKVNSLLIDENGKYPEIRDLSVSY